MTAQQEPVAGIAASAPPVDTSPMYKALIEARLALLAVNSFASQVVIGLIDKVLNAAPDDAPAPALQAGQPDGYLEHTPMGDFLAYSATTKNRQTALYSLEKARAILASPTHERAAPAPEPQKERGSSPERQDPLSRTREDHSPGLARTIVPRWATIAAAMSDPLFQAIRGVMGTANHGQDEALFRVISYFEAAVSAPAQPFGYVTKTTTGVQHFYPDAPYLDNAVECVTVYASPSQPVAAEGVCTTCKGKKTVQVPSFPTGGYSFQVCRACKGFGSAESKEDDK